MSTAEIGQRNIISLGASTNSKEKQYQGNTVFTHSAIHQIKFADIFKVFVRESYHRSTESANDR
ncbi:TPA: hypothetical protein EYN98_08625 [Candidatus Poribacteria bacterium]|nr:hypothetical protein [Candidatus Poribacteria bacterium]